MPVPVYIDKSEGLFPMRGFGQLVDTECRQLDPPSDDRLKGTSATDEPEETSTAT